MFVENYMTRAPETVLGHSPLADARLVMRERKIYHLPVVDEAGRLTGILSDRDVRSSVGFDSELGENLTVHEVMTPNPVTIPLKATLDAALAILLDSHIGALPVVRFDKLVGILTSTDLLNAFRTLLALGRDASRLEIAMPNGLSDAALALSTLAKHELQVEAAVVSNLRRDGDEPSLYLRIEKSCTSDAERRLREAALIILAPEQP